MTMHGQSDSASQQQQRKQSITAHLLSLPSTKELYPRATQSRFLELAGQGKLPLHYLSEWLSQDRLYAQAYVRFIGGLTSLVELPHLAEGLDGQRTGQEGLRKDGGGEKKKKTTSDTLEWRILEMLRGCLENILRELKFFEDTAQEYGIDLASMGRGNSPQQVFGPNETTRGYIELFDSFGARRAVARARKGSGEDEDNMSDRMLLVKGLVVLWTTERVYLDAWLYAAQHGNMMKSTKEDEDQDGGALREAFIPNWTSDAFVGFVEEIRVCLDELVGSIRVEEQGDVVTVAQDVFQEVLSLEEGFWPAVE